MLPSQDPAGRKITLFVIALHALCLLALILNPTLTTKPKHKPLIVNTVIPPPKLITPTPQPRAAPAAHPKPTPIKHTPPKPQTPAKPAPKPTPKKEPAIADKKIAPKNTPAKPKPKEPPRAQISDALKKELEESLAKLNTTTPQAPSKTHPHTIRPHSLQIDRINLNDTEQDYTQALAATLHEELKLPEFGDVKIQLTLHQDGTVVKLVVLKTESQKNKAYLETHLPHIRCPRFEGAYSKKSEYTFTLTFCNK